MVIFYHGDMDGIVSANIYLDKIEHPTAELKLQLYKFEYDKVDATVRNMDFRGGNIAAGTEEFIFLDCCPSEETIQLLISKSRAVTILDHHITKKELINQLVFEGLIKGMSYVGASASLLTWAWFRFDKNIEKVTMFLDKYVMSGAKQDFPEIPYALKLVNSWDIWDGIYPDAEPYKTYFEAKDFIPLDKGIKALLENDIEIKKAIREGNIMIDFIHHWYEQYCQKFGYEVRYLNYEFFVANIGNANSKVFGDRINRYDATIIYCNDGEKFRCSIYSQKKNFNCAEFAEQFGGGGHKGAAGFVLQTLPMWLRDKKSGLLMKGDS